MSLYKRGEVWWIRFTAPNGQRIRRSTGTTNREQAQEFYDQLREQFWRSGRLDRSHEYLWQDAVAKWLNEKEHKASLVRDREIFHWAAQYLHNRRLSEIKRDLLGEMAEVKALETTKPTANRHMAIIRAVLRRAADEWEWIDKAPKVPMYPQAVKRVRWLTREEAERLLSFLPGHQAAMARFALATGLRQRNIKQLAWNQVDLQKRIAWIHPDQAKARKAIGVALNREAIGVLRQQLGRHQLYVFTYMGKPVTQVNTKAWRKAVRKAEIGDFRWHDLRHTWASWHAQAGTPMHILQEMGGWSCAEMVQRYAHLSAEHLRDHAENIVPKAGAQFWHSRQLVNVK